MRSFLSHSLMIALGAFLVWTWSTDFGNLMPRLNPSDSPPAKESNTDGAKPFSLQAIPPASAKLPDLKSSSPLPANLFVELAKAVNPSVVFISTTRLPRGGRSRLPRDPLFDLFEQFMAPPGGGFGAPPGGGSSPMPMQALGTGFVIRKDGLILTNNHVIEGADKIQVSFKDQKEKPFEATIVGRDQSTDIALIKITAKQDFPVLKLGSSEKLEVGEWVAAFGNPYGHSYTMTVGIVSAMGREIDELNRFPFIQTDASINQGNSGGPLVNIRGEVVGVNSAIDARAQGIGFAIPIDNVKSILDELEKTGSVRRGFLGIRMGPIDDRIKKALSLKSTSGVVVVEVEPGSAAEQAGIKNLDVIVGFNGQDVESPGDLQKKVANAGVNTEVKVKIIREGKERNLVAKLRARTDEEGGSALSQGRPSQNGSTEAPEKMGFSVVLLTKALAEDYGIDPQLVGRPLIVQVEPGKLAANSGLRPGDVVLDVNRRNATSAKVLIDNFKSGAILRILRNGQPGIIIID